MTQVFISYTHRDDRNRSDEANLQATLLACQLQAAGFKVWIDHEIINGDGSDFKTCDPRGAVVSRWIDNLWDTSIFHELAIPRDQNWRDKIQDDIAQSEFCLIMLLPDINSSHDYVNAARSAIPPSVPAVPTNASIVQREYQACLNSSRSIPLLPSRDFRSQRPDNPLPHPALPSPVAPSRQDNDDDPPDDLNAPFEPANYDIPGLSQHSLRTYFDAMLQESPGEDRQLVEEMGQQIKARRKSLGLSRHELAAHLDIDIERILLAESGYGELDTVRDLLEQTRQLQSEMQRFH